MASGHPDRTRLRPLTDHAISVMRRIARGTVFPHEVNPGVRDRLYREALIEERQLPAGVRRLDLTAAGVAKLKELDRDD